MWQVVPATMCSGAMRKLAQILFGALNRISCSIFHTWLTEQTTPPPPRSLLHKYTSACLHSQCCCLHTQKHIFLLYADFCLHQWAKMHLGTAASAELGRHVGGYIQCRNRRRDETTGFVVVVVVVFLVQPIEMRFSTCRTPACFIISIFRYGVSLQDKLLIKIWAVLPWLSLMLALISSSWLQVAGMEF